MTYSSRFAALLLASTTLIAPGALAQDEAAGDTFAEDVIIVTATRRAEDIQDVPIAVTAVSGVQLERAGVADLKNLDQVSASFNMNSSNSDSGGTTIRIRGVGTTGNNDGLEQAVGVFIDGVYYSRPGAALGDLVDVAQVEVLRGPQGTLFGRNTSAGALNITTNAPEIGERGGFADFTVGNYGLFNVQAGLNIPAGDNHAFRLTGAVRQRGGTIDSLVTGAESHDRDRFLLRGQYLVEPTDMTSLRIIADYSEADEQCCDAIVLRDTPFAPLYALAGLPTTQNGVPVQGGVAVGNVGFDAIDDRTSNGRTFRDINEQWGLSAELNHEFDNGISVTWIPAYRDYAARRLQPSDFVGVDVYTVGGGPFGSGGPTGGAGVGADPDTFSDIRLHTQELRFQGTLMEDRLNWLVGAYYSDETIDTAQTFTAGDSYAGYVDAIFFGLLAGAGVPTAGLPTVFGPSPSATFAGGNDINDDFANNVFIQEGESVSIFTDNTFDITDQFFVNVGARYVDEKKDGRFDQIATTGAPSACEGTLGNPLLAAPAAAPFTGLAVVGNCFPFFAPVLSSVDTSGFTPQGQGLAAALLPREFEDTFEDEELVYTLKAGYDFGPRSSVYAGFTHGFKSGGFNLDPTAAQGGISPTFESEEVDSYEAGLKTSFGEMKANFAVFHQDLSNFQVLEFTGTAFQTFNVPKAKATGAEVELYGNLTDNFSINVAGTYTDARYPDDCAGDNTSPTVLNLCGASLTNAPEFVGILGGTYEFDFADGWSSFITASSRYESSRRTSTQPTIVGTDTILFGDTQDDNIKIDARIGFTMPNENVTLEFWGTNLTNEITRNVTFNLPLRGLSSNDTQGRGVFVQDPRFYGATLRTSF